MTRIQQLFRELKRRKVFRVAGAYLVAGWVAIEVAETTAPLLALPGWVPRLVLLLVLLGFPIALVLAWALELTPDGLQRTEPADGVVGPDHQRAVSRLAGAALIGTGLLAGALASSWYLTGAGGRVDDRTLAVLPFETLGEDRPTAFTEGVHVGVLTRLSNVADLDVISRTSVLPYRDAARALPEIARELGVAWVVRGEVQEVGDEVLVNARLVDARRDRQVWGEEYSRRLTAENVFRIQSEIAMEIIDALHGELTRPERERVERMPTRDLQAYRLYVQGRRLVDRRTEQGMRASVDYFRRAIERDSAYALAWVGLADALVLLHDYGYLPGDSILPVATDAIDRALELEPGLAEAHASRGLLLGSRKQGPASAREIERALELRPSYAEAHNWRAWGALLLGEADVALERARRAVALDPLSAEAVLNLALAYLVNDRPADALAETRRGREIQPDLGDAVLYEALVHYHERRYDDAIRLLDGLSVPWAGPGPRLTRVLARLATGDTAAAVAARREFEDVDNPFVVGVLHAALGDEDAAFQAFDRVDGWAEYWPTLSVRYFYDDLWRPLRDDPRYERIVEAVDRNWGLEPG